MKPIYRYRDYREALRDYYTHSKSTQPQFSHAVFAKRAGLASPNYLKLVMEGQRNLTTASIQLFGKALALAGDELNYFETLVLENQSETPLEKRFYHRRLTVLKSRFAKEISRRAPSVVLDSPIKPAILLCALGRTMPEAIRFAQQELGVSAETAEAVVRVLLEQGEIHLEGMKLRSSDRHTMMSDPKGRSERLAKFLKHSLEEARETFDTRYPSGSAKFLSLLLTAPEGSLKAMFSDLRSAIEKVTEKYSPSVEDLPGVYRVQLQLYRVLKNED